MVILYSSANVTQDANNFVLKLFCDSRGAVFWASRRQTIVAESTVDAENVAVCEGLQNVLVEVFPRLTIENQAAYVMTIYPTLSRRTRHIELRWHYVHDQVAKKTVAFLKVKSEFDVSDLLTKPLASDRLEILDKIISLTNMNTPMSPTTTEGAYWIANYNLQLLNSSVPMHTSISKSIAVCGLDGSVMKQSGRGLVSNLQAFVENLMFLFQPK
ncbi:Retrovirus-related pol Polyprotein [Phytophthora palmivora]|uniref:Retrovirus-related pol Polyprotein n=1 Tax=Phytophthora palmivora TaxID=4796 RepID=A0A2P4XMR6_9STRA|nr:Retrovirus-related pol Polyprotein [Phytophthora palmivora]